MNWLPSNVRDVPGSLQHGFVAVLSWPWRKKTIYCTIHHHIKVPIIIDCAPLQLICARCKQVPCIPKLTRCGKTVCRKCMGHNNQCPCCTNTSCVASHNSEYAQQINKLQAKCPTPQCQWHGSLEEVMGHLQQCPDATVTCPQCGTSILRKLQFKHEDCCPLQKRKCFYCREERCAKDIIVHEQTECPWRKVECSNRCGNLDILHDKLDIHEKELCPLRLVLCKVCNREYIAEDFEQHRCVPSSSSQPKPGTVQQQNNDQVPVAETEATASANCFLSADYPDIESGLPQSETTSRLPPENAFNVLVTIPIAEYTTQDNTKSKAEALQRLVVSCITLCLLSTIAYLRNQRITDVEFEHDMEIPSVLLWSIFTSVLVFLVILGGSNWYKDLFKNITAKECTVIVLAINFIHLIRFYPNSCLPMILGSLCGSTVEVFLFYKYVTKSSDQSSNTIWIMTKFVAIVLTPFIIIYYSSISNLRVAIMQLIYIIYIVILRKKQGLEKCWDNMTQENRTMGIYLVNSVVLFSITLYSATAISYELYMFSASFSSSLKIILAAVLPIAYICIMAMEQVQDVMLKFGEKLYRSSIYSFWGRLCMVSIFYYTMTICLVIPIVQETGDFIVGSALASVLIVYSLVVQTGLFSKDEVQQILKEQPDASTDKIIKWYEINPLADCLLKVRFVKIADIRDNAIPNTATFLLLAELERIKTKNITTTNDVPLKENTKDDSVCTLSLSVTNKQWTSSNEIITFSSQHIHGPILKNKLGSACLELSWDRYLNDEKSITLSYNIQLNQ